MLAAVVLTSLLLLWAPTSVQGLPTGAPPAACGTFTPQHGFLPQSSAIPYTLFVPGLSLVGNQTYYLPDQEYTSELLLLHTSLQMW